MAGSITIGGSSPGLPSGSMVIGPLTIIGTALIGERLNVVLGSGDNTIAVPSGATVAVVTPPSTNAVVLKLRTNTNSSDGGLVLSPTQPTVYPFPATAPTSLIVNAASLTSGTTEVVFI